MIARVATELSLQSGDRFLVLYGTNTSDTFCTSDLLLQDIEQVLHRYLQNQGFKRLLYYSGVKKLYFLDPDSREATRPQPLAPGPAQPLFKAGPLGEQRRLLQPPAPPPAAHAPSLQDIQILPLLEATLQDVSQATALIFSNAEDLAHFDNRRELFGRMVEWSRLAPSNPNLCVLIFHHESRSELQQFCDRIGFTWLANLIAKRESSSHCNLARLGSPDAQEIRSLIHYFRLTAQKKVNWAELESLTDWIAAENRPLNYWYDRFQEAAELSAAQAREKCWLSGNVSGQPALARLEQMVGLSAVKEAIRRWARTLEVEKARVAKGIQSQPPRLHLIFSGNPGTGKTTVARLIGEIYRELGLLKRGHAVEVAGRDLVAGYVGQTASRTNEIIDRALDGVLLIDEAYTLAQGGEGDFGAEAIETLLKRMEDERQRFATIVAGYPDKMAHFLSTNPGLQRRFAFQIVFPDYQPRELLAILEQQVEQVGCRLAPELRSRLIDLFEQWYEERDETFSNAGLVENLFREMDQLHSVRTIEANLDPLSEPFQLADLPPQYQLPQQDNASLTELLAELESLVGMSSVKRLVKELVDAQLANQRLQAAGLPTEEVQTRHLLFVGNPGTGKTTIARLLGRMYRALGVLRKGQFVEVNRRQLVGQYVGHTAEKTAQVVESALDGVLFIDEAYALSRGEGNDFGQEAIDTLVLLLENYRERLVVIFAGYPREMAGFLASNSGITSRIAGKIDFPDYTAAELYAIFLRMSEAGNRICPPEVGDRLQALFQEIYENRGANFGNGREVRNLYEKMVKRQKSRLVRDNLQGEAMLTFSLEDIGDRQNSD